MGQYYYIVNKTKKQFLYPHKFGDGLKLLEFGLSADGTLSGLAILLASGNGRGGGDLCSDNPIVGSWAGDKIVIAGDYADAEKNGPKDEDGKRMNLHHIAHDKYEDISEKTLAALADDDYYREERDKDFKEKNVFASDIALKAWNDAKKLREENSKENPHKWHKGDEKKGATDYLTYCEGCGKFKTLSEKEWQKLS
jgi:hypothetical protein